MRSVVCSIILASLFSVFTAAFADDLAVLKDVSASVTGGHTRVAFQFAGDVRFSTEQTKNGLRIEFSRTHAAAGQALSRRLLNAGPLESISFQRPAADRIVAVLALAPGSTYRCTCPASGNALTVDVMGTAVVRQAAAPKPVMTPKTSAQAALTPAAQPEPARSSTGSSLIDIAAVARHQVEQEGTADGHDGHRAAAPALLPTPSLIIVSVAVSMAVTALVLLAFSRMMRKEAVVAPAVVVAPAPVPVAQPAAVKAYQQRRREMDEEDDMKPEPDRVRALFGAPAVEEEVEEDMGRETSLQLARSFRRGSEEISLARKFHERPSPALTPGKMQTAMARATTKNQRLSAARKLGVGRGEFDLAEKLKTLSQPTVKNEEEQP
jgi:hypothetical protein